MHIGIKTKKHSWNDSDVDMLCIQTLDEFEKQGKIFMSF